MDIRRDSYILKFPQPAPLPPLRGGYRLQGTRSELRPAIAVAAQGSLLRMSLAFSHHNRASDAIHGDVHAARAPSIAARAIGALSKRARASRHSSRVQLK